MTYIREVVHIIQENCFKMPLLHIVMYLIVKALKKVIKKKIGQAPKNRMLTKYMLLFLLS